MKKVLIVANLGGFASFLLDDIDFFQSAGYDVAYAANGNILAWDDTKKVLQHKNVEFIQIDFDSQKPLSWQNVNAYEQLAELLKSHDFELIHCHTPIAGIIARIAAIHCRKNGTKVIYTTHGFAFNARSSWKQKLIYGFVEKLGSLLCDGIITINQEDYRNACKMYCSNVFYIHGVGIDFEKCQIVSTDRNELRKSLGIGPNDILVMSVGELSTRKNHRIVIEALSLIPDKEKYLYAICGNGIDGGTADMLRLLADEKNVRLNLLGFCKNIPELLSCADMGVLPSIREGLGLAGLETMAVGVPLIGSAVQGITDYVSTGRNGYLIDPFDANDVARAICSLANLSHAERATFAVNCRQTAKNYDRSISIQERKLIYQQFLSVEE